MYRFKRSILLLFILLINFIFAIPSEAARSVTREEFLAALYDARGIESITEKDIKNPRQVDVKVVDVGRGGKQTERNVSVNLKSAKDKAEACFKLGYAGMPNTGIHKVNVPAAGQLNAPITRIEAVRYIVQSLGLSFEALVLSRLPTVYSDISEFSAFERGCVVVAERMIPPILDVNDRTRTFNPRGQVSREDLSKYMMRVRNAVNSLVLDLIVSPAKGVTIRMHREGTFTGVPKWRVNLYGFESEDEAKLIAAQIVDFKMTPHHANHEWSLRGELLDDWRQVEKAYNMLQRLDKHVAIVPSVVNKEEENQPRYWVLATVPYNEYDFKILTPPMGITTLSAMSQMNKGNAIPVLAVNAGYFTWVGRLRGYPIGTLVVDGELAFAPYLRRTTMGWGNDNAPIFGFPSWSQKINLPYSQSETLSSINFYSRSTSMTAYTPIYGIPTPVPEIAATEIILKDGRCVGKANGGTTVNKGDVILAAYGPKALLLNNIKPGDRIDIDFTLTSATGDYYDWGSITNAIQAGPMLLDGGRFSMNSEGFENNFINNRHPRTAIGINRAGNWLFFVGDGRNGTHSIGYTLEETAMIMYELGADYALNFDGGGSSEILVKNQLFNWPSEGRERAISNAIGVFER